jgi:hypothetical protein
MLLLRNGLAPRVAALLLLFWGVLWPARAQAQGVAAYLISENWVGAQISHAQAFVSTEAGREEISYLVRTRRPAGGAASAVLWVLPIGLPTGELTAEAGAHLSSFSGAGLGERSERELRRALGVLVGTQLWTLPTLTRALFVETQRLPLTVLQPGPLMEAGAAYVTLVDSRSLGMGQPPLPGEVLPASLLEQLAPVAQRSQTLAIFRSSRSDAGLDTAESTLAMSIGFRTENAWVPWLAAMDERGRFIEAQLVVRGLVRLPSDLFPEYFTGAFVRAGQPMRMASQEATVLRSFPEAPPPALGYTLPASSPVAEPWGAPLAPSWCWVGALAYFIVATLSASFAARPIWPRHARPSPRITALLALGNLGTTLAFTCGALMLAKRRRVAAWRAIAFVAATSTGIAGLVIAAAVAIRSFFS